MKYEKILIWRKISIIASSPKYCNQYKFCVVAIDQKKKILAIRPTSLRQVENLNNTGALYIYSKFLFLESTKMEIAGKCWSSVYKDNNVNISTHPVIIRCEGPETRLSRRY